MLGGRWTVLVLAAVAAVQAAPILAQADTPVNPERVIEVLTALEAPIRSYQWRFRMEELRARNPKGETADTLELVPAPPTYAAGSAYYDVVNGRYLIETERVSRWSGGADPYVSAIEGADFDGRVFREWKRERHGIDLPSLDLDPDTVSSPRLSPLMGTVSHADQAGAWVDVRAATTGLVHLFPFVPHFDTPPAMRRFSDLLRGRLDAGESLSITETAAGRWRIELVHQMSEGVLRLEADPLRGGVVTWAEWAIGSPLVVWKRMYTNIEEVDADVWAPTEVIIANTIDGITHRITLSDIRLNPDLRDADSRTAFPVGTLVDDFVEQKSFTVGAGPEADADSVRRFLQRYRLSELPSAPGEDGVSPLRNALIVVHLVLLAAFAGYVLLRRRSRRAAERALLLAVVGCGLWPGPAKAAELDNANWAVSHDEELRISQCGFNVAVLALELLNRRYEPTSLSAALAPTADGIRFSDLCDVLAGHGLAVIPRKDVSISDLAGRLRGHQLAIFATPAGHGRRHYLACVRTSGGPVLMLDPPHWVREPTPQLCRELADSYASLAVAFVSLVGAGDDGQKLADHVQFEPHHGGRRDSGP